MSKRVHIKKGTVIRADRVMTSTSVVELALEVRREVELIVKRKGGVRMPLEEHATAGIACPLPLGKLANVLARLMFRIPMNVLREKEVKK